MALSIVERGNTDTLISFAESKTLGKKAAVRQDLVRYRIKRLVENRTISSFLTFVNFAKLGYTDYGVFINTKKMTKMQEQEFVSFIEQNRYVSYFAKVGGKYDFVIGLLARDILHFQELLSLIVNRYEEKIHNRDIAIRMILFHFPKDYLALKDRGQKKLPHFGGAVEKVEIDDADHAILSILATDARASVIELSSKTKIPTSTIALRIKKLEKRGVIGGYMALIDPAAYGFEQYNILIRFSKVTKELDAQIYTFCKSNQYTIWLVKTVGKWDYEIGVEVPNKEAYQELLSEMRDMFAQHIAELDFVVVFKTIKYNLYPLKD